MLARRVCTTGPDVVVTTPAKEAVMAASSASADRHAQHQEPVLAASLTAPESQILPTPRGRW